MRKHILALAAVAATFAPVAALAGNYTLTPIPTSGQSVRYDHGQAFLSSDLGGSSITVVPLPPELRGTLSLSIAVLNRSGQSFNVDPSNVRITTASGKPVKIYTYDELVGRVKRAAGWQTFAVALTGGVQAYANSQPTTVYSNGSATAYSGRYSATANYQSTTRVYNSPATQMANMETSRQTSALLSEVDANAARTSDSMNARILQMTTVGTNQSLAGQIIADIGPLSKKELSSLIVSVTLGGDTHVMNFSSVTTNITNRADRMPEPAPQYAQKSAFLPTQAPQYNQVTSTAPTTPLVVDGVVYSPYIPAK